jgi:regulator of cell morphogenesis and NO signaling
MKITPDKTIGSIVADDYRAASVLTAHGIDFCCKGGRTIEEVCRSKGLDPAELTKEIITVLQRDADVGEAYKSWTLTQLTDHIEMVHHRYVEAQTAVLKIYLNKLCKVHGAEHPELFEILREFEECSEAMAVHMKKEELILFPFVRRMEKAQKEPTGLPAANFGTVENPVQMMMEDHEGEGERFRRIEALSKGYQNPPDGCATYSTAMNMLREFEQDLHMHIHLENNILFPRAIELEKEFGRATA